MLCTIKRSPLLDTKEARSSIRSEFKQTQFKTLQLSQHLTRPLTNKMYKKPLKLITSHNQTCIFCHENIRLFNTITGYEIYKFYSFKAESILYNIT